MDNRAPPQTSAGPTRSFWLYIPPPPLFVATFVAGVQLGRLVPRLAVPGSIAPAAWAVGVAAIGAAALLIVSAPVLFLVHRTTIIPHGTSRTLVTNGPYRVTRNPMYLALVTAYIAVALVLNLLGPLLLLALPLWIINAKVIPVEEAALARVFGDQYRAYQRRVRRWV